MWTLLVAILAVIEASEATAMGTTNEPDIPCCGKQKVRLDELQMLIDDCSIKYRKVRVDWERSECVFECLGRKKAVLDKQGYFNKGGLVKIAESFFTDPDLKSYAKELTTKLEPKVNFTAKQLKKRRRRCNPAFLVGYINTRRLIELKCPKEMKNEAMMSSRSVLSMLVCGAVATVLSFETDFFDDRRISLFVNTMAHRRVARDSMEKQCCGGEVKSNQPNIYSILRYQDACAEEAKKGENEIQLATCALKCMFVKAGLAESDGNVEAEHVKKLRELMYKDAQEGMKAYVKECTEPLEVDLDGLKDRAEKYYNGPCSAEPILLLNTILVIVEMNCPKRLEVKSEECKEKLENLRKRSDRSGGR